VKIKLDENLPRSVAPRLAALGFDVHTVLDEALGGRSDAEVWAAAQAERRFFVTCDLDFSDRRTLAPGSHHGLLIVRLPDAEQWRAADHLVAWFSDPAAPSWEGCLVVATINKVRVVRAVRGAGAGS
jgi:predicted nuclease of predicted toxin-antitoxin system